RRRRLSAVRSIPAPAFVIVGIASTQTGGAIAKTLFDELGPAATAFLRVALAAVLLALIWRPRFRGHARRDLALAAAFGLALCAMNLTFYEAIDRIPLGVAVTIEFAGPLGVAIALSRRAVDAVWVVLAAAGILLLGRDILAIVMVAAASAGSALTAPGPSQPLDA